jgi:hypothetical protein
MLMQLSADLKRFLVLSILLAVPIDAAMLLIAKFGSEQMLRDYVDVINIVPLLIGTVLLFIIVSKLSDKSLKSTTLLFAFGFLFQTVYGFIWFYYLHFSGLGEMQYSGIGGKIGDFFYLGSYVLWTAGAIPYLRRYGGLMGTRSKVALLAYSIVAVIILYFTIIYWYDAAVSYGYSAYNTIAWLSYAVVPTICLFPLLGITLLYGNEGYGKGLLAYYWLYFLVPIIMIASADILNGFYYAISDNAVPGRLDDILYLGAYAVTVAAAYAVLKSQLEKVTVVPSIEQHVLKGHAIKLLEGRGHIVEDAHSNISFELLSRLIKSEDGAQPRKAFVMTRRHPEQLRQQFDLRDVQVTWITTQSGDRCVDPSRPNLLAHAVMEFFQKNKNAIVLIDGIESIVVYNDFDKAVKMLELINDFVMQYRGYLIIPIDPTAFEPRERAIIERNFEIISVPGTGSQE